MRRGDGEMKVDIAYLWLDGDGVCGYHSDRRTLEQTISVVVKSGRTECTRRKMQVAV